MPRYRKQIFAVYLAAIAAALLVSLCFLFLGQPYAWYMREYGIRNRSMTSYLLSRQGFHSKDECEAQLRSLRRMWPRYYCGSERLFDARSEALYPFPGQ